jgi:hypothetical protein
MSRNIRNRLAGKPAGSSVYFDYFSFVSFERERWKKRVGKGRKPRGDLAS